VLYTIDGERVAEVASQLSLDGSLLDVNRVVANGYHSDTVCARCGESLSELECR
jgi:hypothetical protein